MPTSFQTIAPFSGPAVSPSATGPIPGRGRAPCSRQMSRDLRDASVPAATAQLATPMRTPAPRSRSLMPMSTSTPGAMWWAEVMQQWTLASAPHIGVREVLESLDLDLTARGWRNVQVRVAGGGALATLDRHLPAPAHDALVPIITVALKNPAELQGFAEATAACLDDILDALDPGAGFTLTPQVPPGAPPGPGVLQFVLTYQGQVALTLRLCAQAHVAAAAQFGADVTTLPLRPDCVDGPALLAAPRIAGQLTLAQAPGPDALLASWHLRSAGQIPNGADDAAMWQAFTCQSDNAQMACLRTWTAIPKHGGERYLVHLANAIVSAESQPTPAVSAAVLPFLRAALRRGVAEPACTGVYATLACFAELEGGAVLRLWAHAFAMRGPLGQTGTETGVRIEAEPEATGHTQLRIRLSPGTFVTPRYRVAAPSEVLPALAAWPSGPATMAAPTPTAELHLRLHLAAWLLGAPVLARLVPDAVPVLPALARLAGRRLLVSAHLKRKRGRAEARRLLLAGLVLDPCRDLADVEGASAPLAHLSAAERSHVAAAFAATLKWACAAAAEQATWAPNAPKHASAGLRAARLATDVLRALGAFDDGHAAAVWAGIAAWLSAGQGTPALGGGDLAALLEPAVAAVSKMSPAIAPCVLSVWARAKTDGNGLPKPVNVRLNALRPHLKKQWPDAVFAAAVAAAYEDGRTDAAWALLTHFAVDPRLLSEATVLGLLARPQPLLQVSPPAAGSEIATATWPDHLCQRAIAAATAAGCYADACTIMLALPSRPELLPPAVLSRLLHEPQFVTHLSQSAQAKAFLLALEPQAENLALLARHKTGLQALMQRQDLAACLGHLVLSVSQPPPALAEAWLRLARPSLDTATVLALLAHTAPGNTLVLDLAPDVLNDVAGLVDRISIWTRLWPHIATARRKRGPQPNAAQLIIAFLQNCSQSVQVPNAAVAGGLSLASVQAMQQAAQAPLSQPVHAELRYLLLRWHTELGDPQGAIVALGRCAVDLHGHFQAMEGATAQTAASTVLQHVATCLVVCENAVAVAMQTDSKASPGVGRALLRMAELPVPTAAAHKLAAIHWAATTTSALVRWQLPALAAEVLDATMSARANTAVVDAILEARIATADIDDLVGWLACVRALLRETLAPALYCRFVEGILRHTLMRCESVGDAPGADALWQALAHSICDLEAAMPELANTTLAAPLAACVATCGRADWLRTQALAMASRQTPASAAGTFPKEQRALWRTYVAAAPDSAQAGERAWEVGTLWGLMPGSKLEQRLLACAADEGPTTRILLDLCPYLIGASRDHETREALYALFTRWFLASPLHGLYLTDDILLQAGRAHLDPGVAEHQIIAAYVSLMQTPPTSWPQADPALVLSWGLHALIQDVLLPCDPDSAAECVEFLIDYVLQQPHWDPQRWAGIIASCIRELGPRYVFAKAAFERLTQSQPTAGKILLSPHPQRMVLETRRLALQLQSPDEEMYQRGLVHLWETAPDLGQLSSEHSRALDVALAVALQDPERRRKAYLVMSLWTMDASYTERAAIVLPVLLSAMTAAAPLQAVTVTAFVKAVLEAIRLGAKEAQYVGLSRQLAHAIEAAVYFPLDKELASAHALLNVQAQKRLWLGPLSTALQALSAQGVIPVTVGGRTT